MLAYLTFCSFVQRVAACGGLVLAISLPVTPYAAPAQVLRVSLPRHVPAAEEPQVTSPDCWPQAQAVRAIRVSPDWTRTCCSGKLCIHWRAPVWIRRTGLRPQASAAAGSELRSVKAAGRQAVKSVIEEIKTNSCCALPFQMTARV
jgi:hypothetical protein